MTTLHPTCCIPSPAGTPTIRTTVVADWLPRLVARWTRWQRVRPLPARAAWADQADAWCRLADYPPQLLRDVGLGPAERALLERRAVLRALRWQARLG